MKYLKIVFGGTKNPGKDHFWSIFMHNFRLDRIIRFLCPPGPFCSYWWPWSYLILYIVGKMVMTAIATELSYVYPAMFKEREGKSFNVFIRMGMNKIMF